MKLKIKELSSLNKNNHDRIVFGWNDTWKPYPDNKTITSLFEEQVERTPDALAFVYGQVQLTYRQLNAAANRLAHYLINKYAIEPDDLIALHLDRDENMLLAILGVLKAGGAYVPIAPDYPVERVRFILEDAKAKLVLTNKAHKEKISGVIGDGENPLTAIEFIDDEALRERLEVESSGSPKTKASSGSLAYIIYTSGTTGRPKGVMVEHHGVVNLALNQGSGFGLCGETWDGRFKNCLWYAAYVFDAHVSEVFTVITHGHTLYMADSGQRINLDLLKEYIIDNAITVGTIPPVLLDDTNIIPLETIIIAGDVCGQEIMDAYAGHACNVINAYGPTEATVCASLHHYRKGDNNRNIGRPLANVSLYILDENLKVVPVGAVGELYIGGVQIARGYLNLPELTREKFIQNPYQSEDQKAGGLNGVLYKTGDLARYLRDGSVEYAGRNDFQIKIRGFRIEPGEIENKIMSYAGIKQAVVLAKGQTGVGGYSYLAAYYISGEEIEENQLREYLENILPGYMIPQAFVRMEKLPLTVNGKLDRAALPEPVIPQDEYAAPENETEKTLRRIFSKALGLEEERVSVNGNFFRLGGNSIMAIKLANRIYAETGITITVADIFSLKTVRNIARAASSAGGERSEIEPVLFNNPKEQVLSFAQSRLWFIEKYEGESNAYNIPIVSPLQNDVNAGSLKKAITEIIRRHEVLHSVFRADENGEAYQEAINAEVHPFIIWEKAINTINSRDALREEIAREVNRGFNLEKEYPIRCHLYAGSDERYLCIVIHHISFDGWSVDVFMQELADLYFYYDNESAAEYPLEEPVIQYKDYAVWQRKYLAGDVFERQLRYWKDKLDGYENLNLVTDKERPVYMRYEGGDIFFEFEPDIYKRIAETAAALNVSPYAVFLSAYYLMLSSYSNQKDIVLGTAIANRQYHELSGVIGFFANTLAIRQVLDFEKDVAQFIHDVWKDIMLAQRYQDMPFEKVVDEICAEKDTSRSPIFQVMFMMHNFGQIKTGMGKIFKENTEDNIETSYGYNVAKMDLCLSLEMNDGIVRGSFNYALSLFERETIESYISTYKAIVSQIADVSAITRKIKDFRFLPDAEYKEIVYDWNNTGRPDFLNKTITGAFEEQVFKNPDKTAIIYRAVRLSYRELNGRANQLAHYLIKKYKIKPDDLVALCLERNERMVTSILGVLKAGGAYVPVNAGYPDSRIKYIVNNAEPKLVLASAGYKERLLGILQGTSINIECIDTDVFERGLELESTENPGAAITAQNRAYVMYTSGTTGEPKGVMIKHEGVTNLILSLYSRYQFSNDHDECLLLFSNYGFDASVEQLFLAILCGFRLLIAGEDSWMDGDELMRSLAREKVTCVHMTATVLGQMRLEDVNTLNRVVNMGEALPLELFNRLKDKSFGIINSYGPTETTVASVVNVFAKNNDIGRALDNTTVYILDEYLRPLPSGAVGELYIGGAGVARGYINREDLTKERFIQNPFRTEAEKALGCNKTIYKTGDLVRRNSDGTLAYIGRNDFQVKIRGYRIELNEIEKKLSEYPGIKQTTVLVTGAADDDKNIVAYYVSDREQEEESLKKYLEAILPVYMLPARFIYMDKLPVTKNGKLDRRMLPKPIIQDTETYSAPVNETERKLCGIVAAILNRDPASVSAASDFFRIGGDSIKSLQLAGRIQRELRVSIRVKDIFTFRSIRRIYDNVFAGDKENAIRNEQELLTGEFPLFPAQRNFFLNRERYKKYHKYYDSYIALYFVDFKHPDEGLLLQSLTKLVEQHDAFRLKYARKEDGGVIQYYSDAMPEIRINTLDAGSLDTAERDRLVKKTVLEWRDRLGIFDKELFLFGLIKGFSGEWDRVYILSHHLNADAVSLRMVGDDLKAIYDYLSSRQPEIKTLSAGDILGPKGTSCRQWIGALLEYRKLAEREKAYWEAILQASRVSNEKFARYACGEDRMDPVMLEAGLSEDILKVSHQGLEIRIDDILLTAFTIALQTAFGIEHPCLLMVTHGRQEISGDVDVSGTMGWFATAYPIKLPSAKGDAAKTLQRTMETLRKIPNEGIGYNALYINEKTIKEQPRIFFNYQGEFDSGIAISRDDDFSLREYDMEVIGRASRGRLEFFIFSRLSRDNAALLIKRFTDALSVTERNAGEITRCRQEEEIYVS